MSSVLRSVRKRKKGRTLGAVDVIDRERDVVGIQKRDSTSRPNLSAAGPAFGGSRATWCAPQGA